ncbi:hypothetical protein TURU_008834 [Turdus rufiventris]|nr:hypothetical protein TURU_008834 [Turdus rufiventris]
MALPAPPEAHSSHFRLSGYPTAKNICSSSEADPFINKLRRNDTYPKFYRTWEAYVCNQQVTLIFRYDFMYRFNAVLISPVPIMACEIVLELRIWILRTKDMVNICIPQNAVVAVVKPVDYGTADIIPGLTNNAIESTENDNSDSEDTGDTRLGSLDPTIAQLLISDTEDKEFEGFVEDEAADEVADE